MPDGTKISFLVDEIERPPDERPILGLHQFHGRTPTKSPQLQLALYCSIRFGDQAPQVLLHDVGSGTDTEVLLPQRELDKRLRLLADLLHTLQRGQFQVNRNRHCNYCPYTLICPA